MAPPMPCTIWPRKFPKALAEPAQNGGSGEDDDRRDKNGPRAKAVGDPAADGNEDRQHQHVGGHAHVEVDRIPMERAPICGRAVAITVPSRFSMKNAPATRRAIRVDLREETGIGSGDFMATDETTFWPWRIPEERL